MGALFKSIDTDNSKKISRAELNKKLQQDDEVQKLIEAAGGNSQFYILEQLDADGDAEITLDEFRAALVVLDKRQAVTDKMVALFKSIDTDNSQKISLQNLIRSFSKTMKCRS